MEALSKGVCGQLLLGVAGGGAYLRQDLPQEGAHLAQRSAQLPAGKGGLGGGAEENGLFSVLAGAAVGVAGGAGHKNARPHGPAPGEHHLLGQGPAWFQLRQIVGSHGVSRCYHPVLYLDDPFWEGIQQSLY